MGAIVAHTLKMPFAYVRPKPKDHGMGTQIEGELPAGSHIHRREQPRGRGSTTQRGSERTGHGGHIYLRIPPGY